jgi:DNA repair protein RadC
MYQTLTSISDTELREEYVKRFTKQNGEQLRSARESADHLRSIFTDYPADQEHFAVVYLDGQNKIIRTMVVASGTINTASIFPREIIKKVLAYESVSIMISHTHPSGCVSPSSSDRAVTKKLQTALSSIDVDLLDHIIIGDGYFSFNDERLL